MRVLFLLLILTVASCGERTEKKVNYHDVVQGNWETQTVNFREDTVPVRLFIIDNILHYGRFQGNDFFQLKDDRVISDVQLKDASITRNVYLFKILSATKDQLVIIAKSQYFSEEFHCKEGDTLKFQKREKKNNFELKRITFYSSGCNGCCPSFEVEINPNDSVIYSGDYCSAFNGLYIGDLSPGFWELMKEKVQYIDFQNWKEEYSANWTCDQTCGLVFETNNGIYKVSIYGNDKEPRALRDIIEYIFSNYGSFDLTEVDKSKIKFEHEEYIQNLGFQFPQKISIK